MFFDCSSPLPLSISTLSSGRCISVPTNPMIPSLTRSSAWKTKIKLHYFVFTVDVFHVRYIVRYRCILSLTPLVHVHCWLLSPLIEQVVLLLSCIRSFRVQVWGKISSSGNKRCWFAWRNKLNWSVFTHIGLWEVARLNIVYDVFSIYMFYITSHLRKIWSTAEPNFYLPISINFMYNFSR